jgi:hypothetical protein
VPSYLKRFGFNAPRHAQRSIAAVTPLKLLILRFHAERRPSAITIPHSCHHNRPITVSLLNHRRSREMLSREEMMIAGRERRIVGIPRIARYDLMGLYTGAVGWPRAIRVIVALSDDVPQRLLLKSFLFGKCQEVQDSSWHPCSWQLKHAAACCCPCSNPTFYSTHLEAYKLRGIPSLCS